MDVARVERGTRDLIAAYRLSLELVTVRHEPPRWEVTVRTARHRVITLEIPDTGSVADFRGWLKNLLIAEAEPGLVR